MRVGSLHLGGGCGVINFTLEELLDLARDAERQKRADLTTIRELTEQSSELLNEVRDRVMGLREHMCGERSEADEAEGYSAPSGSPLGGDRG